MDYTKFRIPQVAIPDIEVPDINVPNIDLPDFHAPKIVIPGVPELEIPEIVIPEIKIVAPYKRKNTKTKKGEKGKTFRGGKKNKRDKWYGYKNKIFQKWWEKEGKQSYGYDIDSKEMADQVWKEWIDLGKPRVKGVG